MNAKRSFQVKTPWLAFRGDVPAQLDYPDCTLYEAVERCAQKYPDYPAYVFMGRKTSYRIMVQEINLCARALKAIGVRAGDRVTVALPNCPPGGDGVLRHQPGGGCGQHDPSPVQ